MDAAEAAAEAEVKISMKFNIFNGISLTLSATVMMYEDIIFLVRTKIISGVE
jgi:hypothetical protein